MRFEAMRNSGGPKPPPRYAAIIIVSPSIRDGNSRMESGEVTGDSMEDLLDVAVADAKKLLRRGNAKKIEIELRSGKGVLMKLEITPDLIQAPSWYDGQMALYERDKVAYACWLHAQENEL